MPSFSPLNRFYNNILKRAFDFIFSLFLIVILSPFLLIIALLIKLGSRGNVFFAQQRVGKDNKDFVIYKFRTMYRDSEKGGLLTVGMKDSRITPEGFFLRKYKLDELPQLFNVLKGDMSFTGPRPEVRKYVNLYTPEQMKVLSVKPGITDFASIQFSNENEILARAADSEKEYITSVMPAKLEINLRYIEEQSFFTDLKILLLTAKKIISK